MAESEACVATQEKQPLAIPLAVMALQMAEADKREAQQALAAALEQAGAKADRLRTLLVELLAERGQAPPVYLGEETLVLVGRQLVRLRGMNQRGSEGLLLCRLELASPLVLSEAEDGLP